MMLDSKNYTKFISKTISSYYLRDVKDHLEFGLASLKESENILKQLKESFITNLSLKLADESTESTYF